MRKLQAFTMPALAGCIMLVSLVTAEGETAKSGPAENAAASAEADFRASFWHLIIPTGAITADREEQLLRYQACDLAHEIAFLRAIAKLELTPEQAAKLLPAAKTARGLIEKRATYLRDSANAYFKQCNVVRDNNIMVSTGCDRDRITAIIGKQWGVCSPPNYGLGSLDHQIREKFYSNLAALETDAEATLSAAQQAKLATVASELAWIDPPAHSRREFWSPVTDKATTLPLGAMSQLFLAPNAVAWLEQKAGQDATASIKRAKDFQPLGTDVQEVRREGWSYAYRLVDGANILSGMNFTEKELNRLIDLLQGDVQKIHAAHSAANKNSLRPLVALLTDLRDDVANGKNLSNEKLQQVVAYQKRICRGNYSNMRSCDSSVQFRGIFCPIHKDYTDQMEAVFKRLEDGSVIELTQCKLLYETSQCDWFPPKHYRDPVRVGQAAKPIDYPGHKVLATLRSLDDAAYTKQRDDYAREVVAGILGKTANNEAVAKETSRVVAALDKIYTMSDAAYEMDKFTLLAEVLQKPCPEMSSGTGTQYGNNGDIKEMTWDTNFGAAPYNWSIWDFMQAMGKAGKPLPLFSEKPVLYPSYDHVTYLQEWPAHFLMDPAFIPALQTLRVIVQNPSVAGASKSADSDADVTVFTPKVACENSATCSK